MKKMSSLFVRDWEGSRNLVRRDINPDCEWVVSGEGIATRKWDGAARLLRDDRWFARYTVRKGKQPPMFFDPAQNEPDEITGEWPGWVPVSEDPDNSEAKWDHEAQIAHYGQWALCNWTYELFGPKINGNHEQAPTHDLVRHSANPLPNCPRDYDGIYTYLEGRQIEGIVWWRDLGDVDCDKAKIKRVDLGLPWPIEKSDRWWIQELARGVDALCE